ncbi:MAG: hypothetical protein KBD78_02705 [Oligoflexales bacterium]|nr:hypothetical protein [Oligoflexales bacterium]
MRVIQLLSLVITVLGLNASILYSGTWTLKDRSGLKSLSFLSYDFCLKSYNPDTPISILVPKNLISVDMPNCSSNNIQTCLNSIFNLAFPTTASPVQMTTSQYLTASTSVNFSQNEYLGIVEYDLFRTGRFVRNNKTYAPAIIYSSGLNTGFWESLSYPLFVYVEVLGAFKGTTEFTKVYISLDFELGKDELQVTDINSKPPNGTCD